MGISERFDPDASLSKVMGQCRISGQTCSPSIAPNFVHRFIHL